MKAFVAASFVALGAMASASHYNKTAPRDGGDNSINSYHLDGVKLNHCNTESAACKYTQENGKSSFVGRSSFLEFMKNGVETCLEDSDLACRVELWAVVEVRKEGYCADGQGVSLYIPEMYRWTLNTDVEAKNLFALPGCSDFLGIHAESEADEKLPTCKWRQAHFMSPDDFYGVFYRDQFSVAIPQIIRYDLVQFISATSKDCEFEPNGSTYFIARFDTELAKGDDWVYPGYDPIPTEAPTNPPEPTTKLTTAESSTIVPTTSPVTKKPTEKPTEKPTDKPTDKPTEKPTEKPATTSMILTTAPSTAEDTTAAPVTTTSQGRCAPKQMSIFIKSAGIDPSRQDVEVCKEFLKYNRATVDDIEFMKVRDLQEKCSDGQYRSVLTAVATLTKDDVCHRKGQMKFLIDTTLFEDFELIDNMTLGVKGNDYRCDQFTMSAFGLRRGTEFSCSADLITSPYTKDIAVVKASKDSEREFTVRDNVKASLAKVLRFTTVDPTCPLDLRRARLFKLTVKREL